MQNYRKLFATFVRKREVIETMINKIQKSPFLRNYKINISCPKKLTR